MGRLQVRAVTKVLDHKGDLVLLRPIDVSSDHTASATRTMAELKALALLVPPARRGKEQPLRASAHSAGVPAPTARQHLQILLRETVV
ncbi:hypothetical protein QR97_31675 [Streptomyces sp. PBH53]|nr:hypothetical protein QR97_31675 [Streptomyces sp. PBH53]